MRPRTSVSITDLLLLNLVRLKAACSSKKICLYVGGKNPRPKPGDFYYHNLRLFSWLEFRSWSKLTRQIAPPSRNGHAPPPTVSRISYQSVNPSGFRVWWGFTCYVKLSRRLHSWWCPSVNSFKIQLCNHTSPGPKSFGFLEVARLVIWRPSADRWLASFMVRTRTVSNRLCTSNFRSWLMKTFLANSFA